MSLDDDTVEVLVSDLEATGGGRDTPAQQRWYDAVISNRVTLAAKFEAVPPGLHAVSVWRLDDNVVLEASTSFAGLRK